MRGRMPSGVHAPSAIAHSIRVRPERPNLPKATWDANSKKSAAYRKALLNAVRRGEKGAAERLYAEFRCRLLPGDHQ